MLCLCPPLAGDGMSVLLVQDMPWESQSLTVTSVGLGVTPLADHAVSVLSIGW